MIADTYKSEIRDSTIRVLIEKVRKQSYGSYLLSLRLERIRSFRGAQITFDFPVTALVGPNGGGKTTILNAAACVYTSSPHTIFRKSRIGDDAMDDWHIDYDVIERSINLKGSVMGTLQFNKNAWSNTQKVRRPVKTFGVIRTVPPYENPHFSFRSKLCVSSAPNAKLDVTINNIVSQHISNVKREAERILGRSLAEFQCLQVEFTITKKRNAKRFRKQKKKYIIDGVEYYRIENVAIGDQPNLIRREYQNVINLYVGRNEDLSFSEFSFGAGEASVIRMVSDIESLPDGSLVLIEEIENGLHPLAVCRMVDYLIDVAKRKTLQSIFTTHSDYAIASLPSEAIWATIDGRLQQGKLSIEVLRSVSGRIDRRLAIFVEDEFAQAWLTAILREKLAESFEEIGIYPVYGDGNAVKTHRGHRENPAINFTSLCFIDGDSKQREDAGNWIFRLPGTMPESTVFNDILENLDENVALLTLACQRPLNRQQEVAKAVKAVSHTNRDPHVLFSQLGMKIGFVPEATVRGAFLSLWIQEHAEVVDKIVEPIAAIIQKLPV